MPPVLLFAPRWLVVQPRVGVSLPAPPDPLQYVVADENVEMVLNNLLENANRHNDSSHSEVEITIAPSDSSDQWGAIRIADNGPGIPETETDVLTAGEETSLQHASGLGLWLVKRLVDHYGGSIEFEDRTPKGTIVTIRIKKDTGDIRD